MNSRERMLAAINRRPVDRIPTDIWATGEVWTKLRNHFGEKADIAAVLHVDGFAGIGPEYIGPTLPQVSGDESVNFWGIRTKRVPHEGGVYDEQCFYPLAGAQTVDDLNKYEWPDAEWFDYSGMGAKAQAAGRTKAVQCGYMAPFYFHNLLRGLEQSLIDPILDPEFTHILVGRISDFFYDHHRRMFEVCDGLIDVAEVTDDLLEWDYGDYEGMTSEQIQQSVPGWTVWTAPCPGGEAIGAVIDCVPAVFRVTLKVCTPASAAVNV